MSRKMKDSGIEWIGEIPEGWEVRKIKNSFIIISGNGFPIVMQGQEQGDYPVCKASDISANNGKIIFGADNYITQKQSIAFNIIPKGSVVFPKIGEAMKKNNRALLGVDACLDNNCQGLVPLCMNKKYSLYMLSCIDMFWYDNAGTVPCINNLRFSNSYIPFPLLSEQQQIASFLDKKCSEIDSLADDIQKQIGILEQYRKSVITETVTKGLDPNVKMKDSGIEWIGEMPENWKVIKIKNIAFLKGRIGWQGLESKEYQEEGAFLITGTDFEDGTINWDNCVHISEQRYYEDKLLHIKENDLLITKDGTIGKIAIVKNCPEQATLNSGVMYIRGNSAYRYLTKYLYYVLMSEEFWEWYNASQRGNSTIKHLYQEQFYNFIFSYPSLFEQQQIALSLDSKCSKLDKLISLKNQQLETLMQYKKSLIYECVTGKREVI